VIIKDDWSSNSKMAKEEDVSLLNWLGQKSAKNHRITINLVVEKYELNNVAWARFSSYSSQITQPLLTISHL